MTTYVLAVPLGNGRGAAAPLDLLRKVANIAGRVALRRRLDREFSGYLVTEPAALPVWRDAAGRVVVLLCTSSRVHGLQDGAECMHSMDAPEWMPAGSMRFYETAGEVCAWQRTAKRDGWWK